MAPPRGISRYQPLVAHLVARTEPVVWLTSDEIEQIIGATLPPAARAAASFWTRSDRAHTRAWRALGWKAHFERGRAFIIFAHGTGRAATDDD